MKEQTTDFGGKLPPINESDFILRLAAMFIEEGIPFEVSGENELKVSEGADFFTVTVKKLRVGKSTYSKKQKAKL